MTDETINALIATRERLTNLRDEQIDWTAVDLIDDVLSEVPPGQDNRVDLLLGRSCAVLPERDALQAACYGKGVMQWKRYKPITIADAERFRLISEGLPDGIIEHDDAQAGAWK